MSENKQGQWRSSAPAQAKDPTTESLRAMEYGVRKNDPDFRLDPEVFNLMGGVGKKGDPHMAFALLRYVTIEDNIIGGKRHVRLLFPSLEGASITKLKIGDLIGLYYKGVVLQYDFAEYRNRPLCNVQAEFNIARVKGTTPATVTCSCPSCKR